MTITIDGRMPDGITMDQVSEIARHAFVWQAVRSAVLAAEPADARSNPAFSGLMVELGRAEANLSAAVRSAVQ